MEAESEKARVLLVGCAMLSPLAHAWLLHVIPYNLILIIVYADMVRLAEMLLGMLHFAVLFLIIFPPAALKLTATS